MTRAQPTVVVNRLGPACGCQLGGEAHTCGLLEPPHDVLCSGRCLSLGVAERERMAERYIVCVCLLEATQ